MRKGEGPSSECPDPLQWGNRGGCPPLPTSHLSGAWGLWPRPRGRRLLLLLMLLLQVG